MALRIEDYAIVGDLETCALVGYDGSVDWLCLPRFDSRACFTALLGDESHGRWLVAPAGDHRTTGRRYRRDSLVLETTMANDGGVVRIIDFMPHRQGPPALIRVVEGISGRVEMRSSVRARFDYGHIVPWWEHDGPLLHAWAGPDGIALDGDVRHEPV